ncbi:MAG TPA: hypothetical protein VKY65_21235 [Alphaproteobacteria bacterium]|nr:hypothetical protein [Alphaproteobacteria bacterium]
MAIRDLVAAIAVLVLASAPAWSADAVAYKLVKTIDLPGSKGGKGGEVAFDPDTGTVWLCQSPNRNIVVVETKTNTVRQAIEVIDNGGGIAFSEHFAFISDRMDNTTTVIGKRSFETAVALKPDGNSPGATYFDPKHGTLWVTSGSEMTIFKAVGRGGFKRLAGLRLVPYPVKQGAGQGIYVAAKDRIYQPVDGVVDVINPNSRQVERAWQPGEAGRVTSIAYDTKSDRLILGTDAQAVLVLDAKSGKLLHTIPVGGKIGAVAVDAGLRRAYAGDLRGRVDVIDLDRNAVLTTLPSEPEAYGLTVDPTTHFVYVYRSMSNKLDVFAPK